MIFNMHMKLVKTVKTFLRIVHWAYYDDEDSKIICYEIDGYIQKEAISITFKFTQSICQGRLFH